MTMIYMKKLYVQSDIIILDYVISSVPTVMIESVHSQIPFERDQLASSKGEDISDEVHIVYLVHL